MTEPENTSEPVPTGAPDLEQLVRGRTAELADIIRALNREIEHRQAVEESLRQAERRYRGLFEHCIEGIFQTDRQGRLTLANPTLARILGYLSADELIGSIARFPFDLAAEPEAHAVLERRLSRHGVVRGFECLLRRKDGTPVWVALGIRVVWNTVGEVVRHEGTVVDVHDRRLAEETVRRSEERYRRLVETAQAGIWTLSAQGKTDYVNTRMAQLLGRDAKEMLGRPLVDFVADPSDEAARMFQREGSGRFRERFEMRFRHKDESELWTIVSTSPIDTHAGRGVGTLVMVMDISDRKLAEDALKESQYRLRVAYRELERQAAIDGLTGIANRKLFDTRFAEEWRRATRSGSPIALALVDVDHFKDFNDHYGHLAGDECLRRVAMALAVSIQRQEDFVARYGGEEFAVILPDTGKEGAAALAEKMRAAVRELAIPHKRSETAPVVTISVGVAAASRAKLEMAAERLIDEADKALYDAKSRGRDQVRSVDI